MIIRFLTIVLTFGNKGRRVHYEPGSYDSEEGESLSGSTEDSSDFGSEGSSGSLGTESSRSEGSDDALGSDSEGSDETDESEETRSEVSTGPVSRYDFTEEEQNARMHTNSQTWWDAQKQIQWHQWSKKYLG